MTNSLPSPQSDVEITAVKPAGPTNPYSATPPPKTNRRIIFDIGTKAGLPIDRIHIVEKDIVIKQNLADKHRMAAGCVWLPNDENTELVPHFGTGMEPLKIEDCKPAAVRKLAKERVQELKHSMELEENMEDKENTGATSKLKDREVGVDLNGTPPTPNSNRRVLYDLAVAANVTPRRTKKLQNQIRLNQATGKFEYPNTGIEKWKDDQLQDVEPGKIPNSVDECGRYMVVYVVERFLDDLPAEKRIDAQDKLNQLRNDESDSDNSSKTNSAPTRKPPTPPRAAGEKRRASNISTDSISSAPLAPSNLPDPITDCDLLRAKLTKLLDAAIYTPTELASLLHVSPTDYHKFMHAHGPRAGSRNPCYHPAQQFLQHREARGIPEPKPKKRKTTKSSATNGKQKSAQQDVDKIASIHLPGEDTDAVPIFDTCNEIRRKITAYLKRPHVTQAQFMRDISAQFRKQKVAIHASQLGYFRGQKGPTAGSSSNVYYGAYVFFEKLRIAEGKGKTKHREEMERAWGRGGVNRRKGPRTFICRADKRPYEDKYGRIEFM